MMDVYVCEYVCKRVSALHTVVEEVSHVSIPAALTPCLNQNFSALGPDFGTICPHAGLWCLNHLT